MVFVETMAQGGQGDSRSPAALLHRLCSNVTGLSDDALSPHYQYALRVLASNISPPVEKDEFEVAEKIKRKLVRQRREKDAAVFSELHRKLQAQGSLRNRWSVLYMLYQLSQDATTPSSTAAKKAALFSHQLSGPVTTSTPFMGGGGVRVPPQTPGLGLSSVHAASTTHSSKGSSGIGSIHGSLHPSDPSPLPQSFAPSYLPTPGVGSSSSREVALGPRLAWTLSSNKSSSRSAVGLPDRPVSAIVARSRAQANKENESVVTESKLLREVVYILQGIEGKLIKFHLRKDGFQLDDKVPIPVAVRKSVKKLAECGWMYNKIRKYTDSKSMDKAFGLVGQSFCAALHQELAEYYRLMAVLEAQLKQEQDQGIETEQGGLTLKQLVVWTNDPHVRLRALAALVDICSNKKGGALASAIHSYIQHGDPFIRSLVVHTLTLVVQPIYNTIMRWMYDGELEDAFSEFFVASNPMVKIGRIWHDKYSLRKSMIPSFIATDQARKILLTGKSINFLRQLCQDRTVIRDRDLVKGAETKQAETIFSRDMDGVFQKMIDTVYKETSRHLLEVLHNKYNIMDHLKAMRRYLLLGQGDFIRHLMDLLEEHLAKPAATLFHHNLTGILDTAIRATNAQFDDQEILKRLDVRLLEVSPGDTGWDVFCLHYHVDGPISTVFTPESMIMYLRVFNFLWRAKRMEYILAAIWKGQMANAKMLRSIPELAPFLHLCQLLGSEMIHFIQQIQYYINFEVMECSWDELLKKVGEAEDLDYIIAAHQEFLDAIITRSLLDEKNKNILSQLRTIFDLIIQFQSLQDRMYTAALDELQARQSFTERNTKRTDKGGWGVTEVEKEEEEKRMGEFRQSLIPTTRAQLRVLSQSYQDMVQQFLVMVTCQSDLSLRFLSFRLDFNEHYKAKEPKLRSPLTYSKTKKRTG